MAVVVKREREREKRREREGKKRNEREKKKRCSRFFCVHADVLSIYIYI